MNDNQDLGGNVVAFAARSGTPFTSPAAAEAPPDQHVELGLLVTIAESAAIMRFLAARTPGATILPIATAH